MEFSTFVKKVKDALVQYYGSDASIDSQSVPKNNGVRLQGISVMLPGKNIAPTVYLEPYYNRYEKGESFSELFQEITGIYEESQLPEGLSMDFFQDYEKVRRKLVLRLVHAGKNEELLRQIPHLPFLDLAVVCHCILIGESFGTGSVLINNDHLKVWGIEAGKLFEDARENGSRILPGRFHKMGEMVRELLGTMESRESFQEEKESNREIRQLADEIDNSPVPMTVVTNPYKYYGASCILYEGLLEKIAGEYEDDICILPSSVHEVILIPRRGERDFQRLNQMVQEVNETQVDPQEWLSDHVYLYERETGRILGK